MFLSTKKYLLLSLLCAFMLNGCAVMKKDNRVLLNAMDKSLAGSFVTESTTSEIIYSPIIAPAAICAGVIDAAVITPARAIGPAIDDTGEYLWENQSGSDIRKALLFLPKTIATPIVFIGSWTVRSIFTSDL